jgi:hypothetical protein
MAAHTQIRIASLTAAAYGGLLVSGAVYHFQRTGSLPALVRSLSHPALWIALLVAALVTFGLWKRYAWAWWLAMAASLFQGWRIVWPWVERGFAHVPSMPALVALALLLLMLVLLLPRRSRMGCSR